MRYKYIPLLIFFAIFLMGSLSEFQDITQETYNSLKNINYEYANIRPVMWGDNIPGVMNKINTKEKIIALTLDACGGQHGSSADTGLINFLIDNNIKATLFVNIRWIKRNKELFISLAQNPLFEIENHGIEHRPLSVNSREIYNISATGSPKKAAYEVAAAGKIIEQITGRKPVFFRSGTAYYDNVAINIAQSLGYKIAGFTIVADKGATLPAEEVTKKMLQAQQGDIIIAHMNRPMSGTREGIKNAIPILLEKGFTFVHLSEVDVISISK